MPTLNWIGKDAVIRHHPMVAYRFLLETMQRLRNEEVEAFHASTRHR